jgi:protein-tyrosine-phosphatase/DNA-binding transcriptional ArsR family regulator
MPMDAGVERRAAVHAALGEPVRLAIVEELIRSDRTPSFLAAHFGLGSNLLAHHLDVLERVGLVERRVSSGDRRRRYVRLRHHTLPPQPITDPPIVPGSGLAPHVSVRDPARAPDCPATADPSDAGTRPRDGSACAGTAIGETRDGSADAGTAIGEMRRRSGRALFVCTHNSARSQLAAALWRRRMGGPATSAGTHPADRVHPDAVAAAERAGLDLGSARPRMLDERDTDAEVVVTVCDRACEELDPPERWLHWSVADPVEAGIADAFDAALAELDERITAFATHVTLPQS